MQLLQQGLSSISSSSTPVRFLVSIFSWGDCPLWGSYEHVLRGSRLTAPIYGEQAPAAVSGTGDHGTGQILEGYERLSYRPRDMSAQDDRELLPGNLNPE